VETVNHKKIVPMKMPRISIPFFSRPAKGGTYLKQNITITPVKMQIHFCGLYADLTFSAIFFPSQT